MALLLLTRCSWSWLGAETRSRCQNQYRGVGSLSLQIKISLYTPIINLLCLRGKGKKLRMTKSLLDWTPVRIMIRAISHKTLRSVYRSRLELKTQNDVRSVILYALRFDFFCLHRIFSLFLSLKMPLCSYFYHFWQCKCLITICYSVIVLGLSIRK